MYSYENKTSLYLNDSAIVYLKYWYNEHCLIPYLNMLTEIINSGALVLGINFLFQE